MPFRFPPAHPFRSLDALRLIAALGATPAVVRAVMAFIWRDGRDPVAERGALTALVSPLPFEVLIEGSDAKALLRLWTEEAIGAGVFGVPTLAIGGELFWGADAMPMAAAYLADPGLLASPEMARIRKLPAGVERAR